MSEKSYLIVGFHHEQDENSIQIRARGVDGIKYLELEDLEPPYCYIRAEEIDLAVDKFGTMIDKKMISAKNGVFYKVHFKDTLALKNFRWQNKDKFKLWESDVGYVEQIFLDNNITKFLGKEDTTLKYRVLYVDIETDKRGDLFPEAEVDKILSIGCLTEEGEEKWFDIDSYGTEQKMLQAFVDYIEDFDILTAWNLDKFDKPYLEVRCANNGINLIAQEWKYNFCDLLVFYKRFTWNVCDPKSSYSLQNVGMIDLGEGKLEEGMGARFADVYKVDKKKARAYNMQDCWLMKKINEKWKILDIAFELAKLTTDKLEECHWYSNVINPVILREAKNRNWILPDRDFDRQYGGIEGGYVYAKPGIYRNVLVFDFNSLYPSVIRTMNISFDTLDKANGVIKIPETDIAFKAERGIIPYLQDEWQEARLLYKRQLKDHEIWSPEYIVLYGKNYARKTLQNCSYGILSDSKNRIFDENLGSAVTATGRYFIKFVISKAKEQGYEPIYSDTDSVEFEAKGKDPKEIVKEGEALESLFNEEIIKELEKFNQTYNFMSIEFERVYDKFVVFSKKRYINKYLWREGKMYDKVEYSGIELMRSDFSELCKNVQHRLMDIIMTEDDPTKIKLLMRDYIRTVKAELFRGEHDKELAFHKSINPRGYTTTEPIHVRAANLSKAQGIKEYRGGDKVEYVICGFKKEDKKRETYGIPEEMFKDLSSENKGIAYSYNYYYYVLPLVERFIEPLQIDIKTIEEQECPKPKAFLLNL